jgi:uncharacterized membrane protein
MALRTARALLLAAAAAALVAPPLLAHKGHASPKPSPSPATPPAAEPAAAGPVEAETPEADRPPSGAREDDGPVESDDPMKVIPWRTAFTDHLHNKIVHFPLALGVAAAVMLLFAPRWPVYGPPARALLVACAVFAVAAYLTGIRQASQFDDSPFHSVVELHEKFGIATGLTLIAGAVLGFVDRARRYMPLYAVLLLLLLAATGFLGGVLSHS